MLTISTSIKSNTYKDIHTDIVITMMTDSNKKHIQRF